MSSNSFLQPQLITSEMLAFIELNCCAAWLVNRQFENQFNKIGQELTIRKPDKAQLTIGTTEFDAQSIVEQFTTITVNRPVHADFVINSVDMTLTIEEFSERYLKSRAIAISTQVDYDILQNYVSLYNMVGTPGSVPSSYDSLTYVGERLDDEGAPGDRYLILGPKAFWSMNRGLVSNYVEQVAGTAFKGFLTKLAGFEIYNDQNAPTHTNGAYAGTPVVNGGGQTGSSIVTNGWTASITGLLNIGDKFTLSGVYAVNPITKVNLPNLRNFVVTSVTNSDGSGNATIGIYPPITTSGAYQTVSNAPSNLAPITIISGNASTTYGQNVAFTRDCFGLVTVPYDLPEGVDYAATETWDGINISFVRDWDIRGFQFLSRLDVLYGTSCFYPEFGCILTS